jgi:chromosome segregation ATPase
MTETPHDPAPPASSPAPSTVPPSAPRLCKLPGCDNEVPEGERGRKPLFCTPKHARKYHNDTRYKSAQPAAEQAQTGQDVDPVVALEELARQLPVAVRRVLSDRAQTDPEKVRARLADAEAAQRRAEARAATAEAQAREAVEEREAAEEAAEAERQAQAEAEARATDAEQRAEAAEAMRQAGEARAVEEAARVQAEADQRVEQAEAAARTAQAEAGEQVAAATTAQARAEAEAGRARQGETDARAEVERVRADAEARLTELRTGFEQRLTDLSTARDDARTSARGLEAALAEERTKRDRLAERNDALHTELAQALAELATVKASTSTSQDAEPQAKTSRRGGRGSRTGDGQE